MIAFAKLPPLNSVKAKKLFSFYDYQILSARSVPIDRTNTQMVASVIWLQTENGLS